MLIVDTPMPDSCTKCPMVGKDHFGQWRCNAYGGRIIRKVNFETERSDWCPIKGELVRCGECYYKEEKRIMDEDALWCRKHHMYVTDDWFCSDGERK